MLQVPSSTMFCPVVSNRTGITQLDTWTGPTDGTSWSLATISQAHAAV